MDGDVIQKDWLGRVKEVVDYAYDNDLFVIINMHHDDYIWFNPTEAEYSGDSAKYKKIWAQVADYFEDYGDRLIMTHLNDNLGLTSPDGRLVSTDDLDDWPYTEEFS